jgi:hypothetical protein
MTFTDQMLQDFLAGTADAATTAAIENAVETDVALQLKLAALDPFAAPIKDAFDTLALGTVTQVEMPTPAVVPSWNFGAIAASLVIGLGLGAAGVFGWMQPEKSDWRMEVADYQVLYVPETIAHLSSSPEGLTAQFGRAGAAIGLDFPGDELSNVDGLTLKRAQVLGHDGDPLIQIVFQDKSGSAIALCLIAKSGTETQPRFTERRSMVSVDWDSSDHAFLLIGNASEADAARWADNLRQILKNG